jgi:hypothetical protein
MPALLLLVITTMLLVGITDVKDIVTVQGIVITLGIVNYVILVH